MAGSGRSWAWGGAVLGVIASICGCATAPPSTMENACTIFRERPDWWKSASRTFEAWGVPVHVQLAIIKQESGFRHDAKPPYEWFLIVPLGRGSSAYGYAQVKDETWDWYRAKSSNRWADRDDFADASDFIGWYANMSYKQLGVSKWDAFNQYLAYHEGHGGFRTRTYESKPWLIKVARKVERYAALYRAQIGKCRDELNDSWLWPF